MRWMIAIWIVAPAMLLAATFENARMDMPVADLRAMLEDSASAEKQTTSPEAAILSASYEVLLDEQSAAGKVVFEVQTFAPGWHLVPLISDKVVVVSVHPDDATMVRHGHFYAMAVSGLRRMKVEVAFHVPIEKTDSRQSVIIPSIPCPQTSIKLGAFSGDNRVRVAGAQKLMGTWFLAATDSIRIDIAAANSDVEVQAKPLAMPAIVSCANATMKVVRDGGLIATMRWHIRHREECWVTIRMPEDVRFVSFLVGGHPSEMPLLEGRDLKVCIPQLATSTDGTDIEFTYIGRKLPFGAVRGDLPLELPSTPVFVEKYDWQVVIPSDYEPIAVEGNVECLPSKDPGTIQLRKEIASGDVPRLRLFYKKRESNK